MKPIWTPIHNGSRETPVSRHAGSQHLALGFLVLTLRIIAYMFIFVGGIAVSAALHVRQREPNFKSQCQPDLLPHELELGLPFAILALGIASSAPGPCHGIRCHWAILLGWGALFVAWWATEFVPRHVPAFWLMSFFIEPERGDSNPIVLGLLTWIGWITVALWGLLWGLDWVSATYRRPPGATAKLDRVSGDDKT